MKTSLGYVLIVLGAISGAASAARVRAEPGLDPEARFAQLLGGALFTLTLVGAGFFLVRWGRRSRNDHHPRRPAA